MGCFVRMARVAAVAQSLARCGTVEAHAYAPRNGTAAAAVHCANGTVFAMDRNHPQQQLIKLRSGNLIFAPR